ncbi:hypothetical protein MSP8886_01351 [Marinomonas spartinae]|uniref:Uncharacterized protein n=1 Tax=Marinomonas spartinae TaxID=1792290 RepID=A0A1A8T8B6_9GAMM|nr:hypothetical protein [Marinomonas spartinae]SBS28895.1 hypothetical protein MSP8886_01351 [Marinomonas spartinae]
MFNIMELRIIRASVKASMDGLLEKLKTIDPDSDEAVEISNDLMFYQSILDTISENPEV